MPKHGGMVRHKIDVNPSNSDSPKSVRALGEIGDETNHGLILHGLRCAGSVFLDNRRRNFPEFGGACFIKAGNYAAQFGNRRRAALRSRVRPRC